MGEFLTAGDLALIENRRGYGYGDEHCHRGGRGMAATGIGLSAGLGGGALLLALAAAWGLNQASKARNQGTMKAVDLLAQGMLQERQSRETWQDKHSPSTVQYVDVQTGAGAFSGSTSNALATALALNNNSGLNSAIGGCNFLRVAKYSAPVPCGCESCGD